MTAAELLALLGDPDVRQRVQGALGLPSDPVAATLKELAEETRELRRDLRALTAAQAQTDAAVKELALAQARTDAALKELAGEVKELAGEVKELGRGLKALSEAQAQTNRAVGALSDNVGFGLEELAGIVLPDVLAKHGVHVARFDRRFFVTSAGEEEVDLYAEVEEAGEPVVVIGETKARIYTGDVQKFETKAERVASLSRGRPVRVMFGFMVHPKARALADALGIHVVAVRPAA